tara:strand:- start:1303 stop:1506 length:204 start_codon:yes stop_codon:yes gene_type:complete
MRDTVTVTKNLSVPKEEYTNLYAIKLSLETYFSYLEDNRGGIKEMAPLFLEDAKDLIKKYNKEYANR